jgi:hypothetical protein
MNRGRLSEKAKIIIKERKKKQSNYNNSYNKLLVFISVLCMNVNLFAKIEKKQWLENARHFF